LLPIGLAAHLAQDALLFVCGVSLGLAAPVAGFQGARPKPVEPRDEERNGIAAAPPAQPRCLREAVPVGDGEQRPGPRDHRRRLGLRPAQAEELRPLLRAEGAQRIFLST
jgi:hypothetical protein